jgi:hypothetical protein
LIESFSRCHRILAILLILLAQPGLVPGPRHVYESGEGTGSHPDFFETALAPTVAASTFLPENFHKRTHAQVIKAVSCPRSDQEYQPKIGTSAAHRESWSRNILPFPRASRTPRLATSRRHDRAHEIDYLVKDTRTQKEALQLLLTELGWHATPSALSQYMKRWGISASWQRTRQQLDAGQVQAILNTAENTRDALKRLRERFNWSPTNLSTYLARHGFNAPWLFPHTNRDLRRIDRLVHTTRSRKQAVELLRAQLGWAITPNGIGRYLRRQGIAAPWQHIYRATESVQELVRQTGDQVHAIERLNKELGWVTTAANLSKYMKRHGIRAPWTRSRSLGATPIEMILLLALLSITLTVLVALCRSSSQTLSSILYLAYSVLVDHTALQRHSYLNKALVSAS